MILTGYNECKECIGPPCSFCGGKKGFFMSFKSDSFIEMEKKIKRWSSYGIVGIHVK